VTRRASWAPLKVHTWTVKCYAAPSSYNSPWTARSYGQLVQCSAMRINNSYHTHVNVYVLSSWIIWKKPLIHDFMENESFGLDPFLPRIKACWAFLDFFLSSSIFRRSSCICRFCSTMANRSSASLACASRSFLLFSSIIAESSFCLAFSSSYKISLQKSVKHGTGEGTSCGKRQLQRGI